MVKVVCIGGGPAGLTAAYTLIKHRQEVMVLEADSQYVGGISRTVECDGFCFDIGGHRFFSKSTEVTALWREILGSELLTRLRKSQIYYKGKFYPYPLDIRKTLTNLGVMESVHCGVSYLKARFFPIRRPKTFEQWIANQFGMRLFQIFFKSYTEKIWGIPCNKISADWAAQRIKGLSFSVALRNAIAKALGWKGRSNVKTLTESFLYPRKGPGMMWEAMASKIIALGGKVELGNEVKSLSYLAEQRLWRVEYDNTKTGKKESVLAEHVISSMPLHDCINAIVGSPDKVRCAASSLRYRDFLIVALLIKNNGKGFDDNWIYIHDPGVLVGRIQNFRAWSEDMTPTPDVLCYGMEYFCNEGDELWNYSDDDLIRYASQELVKLKLAQEEQVVGGYVVRQRKAYPVYDQEYMRHVGVIRDYLAAACPNFQVVGRNGMHKYNNQDHSMMTAMLAAKNVLVGGIPYDVWGVNQDAEYHEEGTGGASGERLVPISIT